MEVSDVKYIYFLNQIERTVSSIMKNENSIHLPFNISLYVPQNH